ncbi:hypothetical protein FFI89_017340 [Bradyrhizobium sp. KBS0727]|uniref:hypothetical protein n=1 Tax=unclassified Bradyrhizobium TaxID=2631580 RepID=UPI00110D4656|nr:MULTISPECIES: hypothetical protein [unclassified Bradyrhizobium]QDW38752.1 hypothetical protein FFI71_017335 [Bradyrhizobium sp. KBS0725]QDW45356.1 hypothetical protein FFI89_017340 [Bradyrhizobium sp. KBS0727]
MQILTPSGYKSPIDLASGDDVCAFDVTNGAQIINHVENIDYADYAAWCSWWSATEGDVPPFTWYRINDSYVLFREQSIWRNGTNVCHAKNLVVGDEIYDDTDRPLQITSVEPFEDISLVWYRFDISGDHSYIVDGLTVHNANRNWVGGTGTWDSSTTTHWAASSGGAGGQSVPGAGDAVGIDGNSGGGTVTLNFGGTITIQSIAMGSFTGTFDNSVNNNNISMSSTSSAFSGSGTATRTYKLGTATYTVTGNGGVFSIQTGSNLTFTGNTGSTISFTGTGGSQITTSGQTLGTVNFGATAAGGVRTITQTNTFTSITMTAPLWLEIQGGETQTINTVVNWVGNSTNQITLVPSATNGTTAIAFAAGSTMQWCALRGITATGSPAATNSFNLLNNSGFGSLTAPSGGGGGYVIGC